MNPLKSNLGRLALALVMATLVTLAIALPLTLCKSDQNHHVETLDTNNACDPTPQTSSSSKKTEPQQSTTLTTSSGIAGSSCPEPASSVEAMVPPLPANSRESPPVESATSTEESDRVSFGAPSCHECESETARPSVPKSSISDPSPVPDLSVQSDASLINEQLLDKLAEEWRNSKQPVESPLPANSPESPAVESATSAEESDRASFGAPSCHECELKTARPPVPKSSISDPSHVPDLSVQSDDSLSKQQLIEKLSEDWRNTILGKRPVESPLPANSPESPTVEFATSTGASSCHKCESGTARLPVSKSSIPDPSPLPDHSVQSDGSLSNEQLLDKLAEDWRNTILGKRPGHSPKKFRCGILLPSKTCDSPRARPSESSRRCQPSMSDPSISAATNDQVTSERVESETEAGSPTFTSD